MAVTPEALKMLKRAFEAGSVSGCGIDCGACPTACFQRPRTGELGKVYFVGKSQELYSEKSPGLRPGTFVFNSPSQSGELPIRVKETSEKICSKCNENPCTCLH